MIRSLIRSVIHDARVTHAGAVSLQVDACHPEPRRRRRIPRARRGSLAPLGMTLRAGRQGDTITITCYGMLHEGQTLDHKPRMIRLDPQNRVVSVT